MGAEVEVDLVALAEKLFAVGAANWIKHESTETTGDIFFTKSRLDEEYSGIVDGKKVTIGRVTILGWQSESKGILSKDLSDRFPESKLHPSYSIGLEGDEEGSFRFDERFGEIFSRFHAAYLSYMKKYWEQANERWRWGRAVNIPPCIHSHLK